MNVIDSAVSDIYLILVRQYDVWHCLRVKVLIKVVVHVVVHIGEGVVLIEESALIDAQLAYFVLVEIKSLGVNTCILLEIAVYKVYLLYFIRSVE